jgi:hypothetical protein
MGGQCRVIVPRFRTPYHKFCADMVPQSNVVFSYQGSIRVCTRDNPIKAKKHSVLFFPAMNYCMIGAFP